MPAYDIVSEKELVEGCIRQDSKYQEMLYRKYAKNMFGVCLGYAKDHATAKDILQDGFIKIFKKIDKFSWQGSLEGWIRRIIINTAIDDYRKSVRQREYVELEEKLMNIGYNNVLEELNTTDVVKLIHFLPEGARVIFNLYTIEGYGHKEIAEQLGISEGTSKSQYARAKKLLQDMILEDAYV